MLPAVCVCLFVCVHAATKKVDPTAINVMTGKSYEQEFEFEQQRRGAPKVRSTPWGSSYREAPEILHGYTSKVSGGWAGTPWASWEEQGDGGCLVHVGRYICGEPLGRTLGSWLVEPQPAESASSQRRVMCLCVCDPCIPCVKRQLTWAQTLSLWDYVAHCSVCCCGGKGGTLFNTYGSLLWWHKRQLHNLAVNLGRSVVQISAATLNSATLSHSKCVYDTPPVHVCASVCCR